MIIIPWPTVILPFTSDGIMVTDHTSVGTGIHPGTHIIHIGATPGILITPVTTDTAIMTGTTATGMLTITIPTMITATTATTIVPDNSAAAEVMTIPIIPQVVCALHRVA